MALAFICLVPVVWSFVGIAFLLVRASRIHKRGWQFDLSTWGDPFWLHWLAPWRLLRGTWKSE